MVVSTLNRTLRSLALAKIAAEYLLRWVPAGAHDWRRFLSPQELRAHLLEAGCTVEGPVGVVFQPLSGQWRLSPDSAVNYMMTAAKAPGHVLT